MADHVAGFAWMLFFEEDSSSESDTDSNSSVSESEDEEDINLLPLNALLRSTDIPRMKKYVEDVVSQMPNDIFISHFRLNRSTINTVGDMIMRDPHFLRLNSISLWKQLLITLWVLSTPDSYRSVSDRFDVSKSTVWLAVYHTCSAIARLSVSVIKWPTLPEMHALQQDFFEVGTFPGVIGCIDGTHIPISAPKENPSKYINRKDFHSIILQGIATRRLHFIDCYVGEVGAVHDARVFRHSAIGSNLSNTVPANFHLLGDCAYPLLPNLMTPFRDNGHLTRRQVSYNYKLSKTRSCVERAFALLKGRFRRLKYLDMKRTDVSPTVVMACCVLHNLLQAHQAQDLDEEVPDQISVDDDDDDDDGPPVPNNAAVQKRLQIMNNL